MVTDVQFADAVGISRCIVAAGVLIWTLEYFALARYLGRNRILSWDIGQLRFRWTSIDGLEAVARWVFGPVGGMGQLAARFLAALLLLAPNQSSMWYALALFTIALSSIAWFIRSPQGQDGSDQVFLLLAGSMAIGFLANSATTWNLVMLFVVLQLTICYLTAGLTKLRSPEWRNGIAIEYVFRTSTYGNSTFYDLIRSHQGIRLGVTWFVIIFEVIFPLAFFVPRELGMGLIAIPLGFHLATALLMGLNLFLISFLAAYPFVLVFILGESL